MLLKIIKKADWQFKFEGLNSFYNFPRTTMITKLLYLTMPSLVPGRFGLLNFSPKEEIKK